MQSPSEIPELLDQQTQPSTMNPVIRTSNRTRKNITRYEEDPDTYATTLYSLQRQRQFNQRKKKALMKAFAAEVIAPVQ